MTALPQRVLDFARNPTLTLKRVKDASIPEASTRIGMNEEDKHFQVALRDGSKADSLSAMRWWSEIRRLEMSSPELLDALEQLVRSAHSVIDPEKRARLQDTYMLEQNGAVRPLVASLVRSQRGADTSERIELAPFVFQTEEERLKYLTLLEWSDHRHFIGGPNDVVRALRIDSGLDETGERDR